MSCSLVEKAIETIVSEATSEQRKTLITLLEKCGGPGSGVPGPCPLNKPQQSTEGRVSRSHVDSSKPEYSDEYEAWHKSLSKEEKDAFGFYTGDGYKSIRKCQAKAECSEKAKKAIEALNASISDAPKFSGKVYRGLSFANDKQRASFIAKLQKQGELEERSFASTTQDPKVAKKFAGSNVFGVGVLLTFEMKSGVEVSKFSSYNEKEVLLPAGKKFKYKSMKKSAAGHLFITLEESD